MFNFQGMEAAMLQMGLATYSDTTTFTDMLKDEDRNEKYLKAIKIAVERKQVENKKSIVLDLGCGTGLLTMMALSAGADFVYACDEFPHNISCCKKVLHTNGMDNKRVKLIAKNSKQITVGHNLDMSRKANILVTEIFDTELIGEGCIASLNHAKAHLLTDDAIIIPERATLFAQVVDCPLIRDLSIFKPIEISETMRITFPETITNCSSKTNADQGLDLIELAPGVDFRKISLPLSTFQYDWATSEKIPEDFDTTKTEFVVNSTAEANAVFTWWEMQLITDEEVAEEDLIISCKPRWARGAPTYEWRFHWQQSAYYGFKPVPVREGNTCYLESYRGKDMRNKDGYWFKITQDPRSEFLVDVSDPFQKIKVNACLCYFHDATSPYHFAMQHDPIRTELYVKLLRKCIIPDVSICLCLSESSIILPLLAVAMGAKIVYIEEQEQYGKLSSLDLITSLLMHNNLPLRVHSLDIQDKNGIPGNKVQIVLGDPFYREKLDNYLQNHVPPLGQRYSPWHHLTFWRRLNQIPPNLLNANCIILPNVVKIKGLAVNFDNFSRPFTPLAASVCGGRYDLQDFTKMIAPPPSTSNPRVGYHTLWEHSSKASSEVFNLLEIDFTSKPNNLEFSKNIKLHTNANAVVFWCEWKFGKDDDNHNNVLSTGLLGDVGIGSKPKWYMNQAQAVIFSKTTWSERLDLNIELNMLDARSSPNLSFSVRG